MHRRLSTIERAKQIALLSRLSTSSHAMVARVVAAHCASSTDFP
jgi:hypothetical protein